MPFYADEDGEYQIVVIPGRGILGARSGDDAYRLGVGIDKILMKRGIHGLRWVLFRRRPGPKKDGRFRVTGLDRGLKYSMRVWKSRMIVGETAKHLIIEAGETKDLGDIKAGE
jgi:hypothetical protein